MFIKKLKKFIIFRMLNKYPYYFIVYKYFIESPSFKKIFKANLIRFE